MKTYVRRSGIVLFGVVGVLLAVHLEEIDQYMADREFESYQNRYQKYADGAGFDSIGTGPFGLWMGMTIEDLPKEVLSERENDWFIAHAVPRPNADLDQYVLHLDPRFGLTEIRASKSIYEAEEARAQLRPWFYRITNALAAVYGPTTSHESLHDENGNYIRDDTIESSTTPLDDPLTWCTEVASERRRVWALWPDSTSEFSNSKHERFANLEWIGCYAVYDSAWQSSWVQIVYRFVNHAHQVACREGL